ncbi:MAG: hypothetical protein F4Z14_01510 [Gammaproteobacteria bacterium]|nr:hypothetical protein [Gammaproteobacteria bacterium]
MRVNKNIFLTLIGVGSVASLIVVVFIFNFSSDSTSSPIAQKVSSIGETTSELNHRGETVPSTNANQLSRSRDVWEICGLSEFPTESAAAKTFVEEFEISQECLSALEIHTLKTNPFERNGLAVVKGIPEFSLVILDNSMTYARIFEDPAEDLQRIIEALSQPDCEWEEFYGKKELNEVCHAEALTNYATFYHACFNMAGEKSKQAKMYFHLQHYYIFEAQEPKPDNITDMWQGYLEYRWVEEKCKEFGSEVALNAENYPREFATLRRYSESRVSGYDYQLLLLEREKNPLFSLPFTKYDLITILLDFGAELGDEAAGLVYLDRGVFANKLNNGKWTELKIARALSTERLRESLWFVLGLERKGVEINWDWLVSHICSSQPAAESDKNATEPENCRAAINDLYTKRASSGQDREDPLLVALDRFQRIAIELDVYE